MPIIPGREDARPPDSEGIRAMMTHVLLVGLGGGLGSALRFVLTGLASRHLGAALPWGTLAVNVAGCLAIGAVQGVIESRPVPSQQARLFLSVGILGGFTTFSAFGSETMELLREGAGGRAMANVAANVVLGLAAVWLGRTLIRLIAD